MTADERRHHAEATLDSLADGVLSTDLEGRINYLNHAAELMTGWSHQAALGRRLSEVFNTVGRGADCVLIRRDGREIEIELNSTPIVDASGRQRGAVMTFHDVSAARRTSRRLSHLAEYDALTDLPNRLLLRDRLNGAIALADRHQDRPVAVLFLDVDGFKSVNDSLGHAAGDALLQSIASNLTGALRKADTVSRYSGDEFVIVLPEIEHRNDAELVAIKLVQAASGPHHIDSRNVTVTASVGIALYPDDGQNAETLIRHADAAMYEAKRTGPGGFRVFTPALILRPDAASSEPPSHPVPVMARRRNMSRV